jgi:hypothetical protein
MNRFVRTIVAAAGLLTLIAPATGSAHDDTNDARLRTDLSGFSEVIPPNLGLGAIFSTGSGRLKLKIDKQNRSIDYEPTYSFPDAAASRSSAPSSSTRPTSTSARSTPPAASTCGCASRPTTRRRRRRQARRRAPVPPGR